MVELAPFGHVGSTAWRPLGFEVLSDERTTALQAAAALAPRPSLVDLPDAFPGRRGSRFQRRVAVTMRYSQSTTRPLPSPRSNEPASAIMSARSAARPSSSSRLAAEKVGP